MAHAGPNMRARSIVLAAMVLVMAAPAPLPGSAGAVDGDALAALPVVAVIDSGIDATHPEFAPGQVVAWRDFRNGLAAPYDDHGHGTATAGRVAGATTGAFPGAPLAIAKVLDAAGKFPTWVLVANAIDWAVVDAGASVISISLWSQMPSPVESVIVADAITRARDAGVLVVVIAGNGGELVDAGAAGVPHPVGATFTPGASSPGALSVGGAYDDGARAPSSSLDPELLAHGAHVRVATRGNGGAGSGGYESRSGTSYAAPWVAGVAARLLADGAPRDPDALEWLLLHVARDDPAQTYAEEGYGFLDAVGVAAARDVASGRAPMPGWDTRDAFHAAATAARVAMTANGPTGILPP